MGETQIALPATETELLALIVLDKFRHVPQWKYYIHPDCHEMLKPQEGDYLILDKSKLEPGYFQYFYPTTDRVSIGESGYFRGKFYVSGRGDDCMNQASNGDMDYDVPVNAVKVLQRNGKPFFMPEVDNN